jgi:hypothetical protein
MVDAADLAALQQALDAEIAARQQGDQDTLDAARSHAEAKMAEPLAAAQQAVAAALAEAKIFAQGEAEAALDAARSYVDAQVAAGQAVLQTAIANALAEGTAYADAAAAQA